MDPVWTLMGAWHLYSSGLVVLGRCLDLAMFNFFSNLNDSVISFRVIWMCDT